MTVINIDIPRIIPITDIFDIMLMKLELLFDRKNLYASSNRIKILYHRVFMNQVNKSKLSLITDHDSNGIVLAWPDIYRNKAYWIGLLKIYYEIIKNCLANNKHIILTVRKNSNIYNDLSEINKEINSLIAEKKMYFHLFELDYDDIWLRDQGPLMIKDKNGIYGFNIAKFNGYGERYNHEKDKNFALNFLKKYKSYNSKYLNKELRIFNDLVIEPGNLVFDEKLCIVNKIPLLRHNKFDWNIIDNILERGFRNVLNIDYRIISSQPITGDDTNGHIDNLIRLDKKDTLYYMATNDKSHPDYSVLKSLERQIIQLAVSGRNLIPIYHDSLDVIINSNASILPFSYMNYIKIGDLILMPINNNTSENKKNKIQKIFKHDNVIFIETDSLLHEKGGLHCCSMNIKHEI